MGLGIMLKYNLFLYGTMFAVVSFVFSANCFMNTDIKVSLPKFVGQKQLLVDIRKEQAKNNGLLSAFNIIAQSYSQAAVGYTAVIQSVFVSKLVKEKLIKDLTVEELNAMSIEKKRLALSLILLKADGTFMATHDESHEIAAMPSEVKNLFKDITVKVPVSSTGIAWRVVETVGLSVLPDLIAGVLISGYIGAKEDNCIAQELHEQNKQIVYKNAYKQAFEDSYAQYFEDQVSQVITKDGCFIDVLAQFVINTAHGDDVGDIGLIYGQKFKQHVRNGNLNVWQAFYEASIEECQKRLNPVIRESTIAIANRSAKTVADLVVHNLAKPVDQFLSTSGMKNGAALGLFFGAFRGLMTSWCKGDFTRPALQEKIGNL